MLWLEVSAALLGLFAVLDNAALKRIPAHEQSTVACVCALCFISGSVGSMRARQGTNMLYKRS